MSSCEKMLPQCEILSTTRGPVTTSYILQKYAVVKSNGVLISLLDVDPLMKGAVMDWRTVPSGKNIPGSAVSSLTPVAHLVPVTCILILSHSSAPVSMISACTLQLITCCVLLCQPMREPALFWD